MRTWWLWASVVALCVSPALAEAREKARERGDGRGRHSSWDRRPERGHRDRGAAKRDRSDRRDNSRSSSAWRRGNSSSRGRGHSDRGWTSRRNGDGRHRSYSRSFRHAPRYPSFYRHGYYHRHGYYFPRYYYDYGSYTTHASVRVLVEPEETEVYVDGYYAGIVDDFDGVFQRLNLAPGRHEITLRLDGHETWSALIYAQPGSTVRLHHDMARGAFGPEIEDYSNGREYDDPEARQP